MKPRNGLCFFLLGVLLAGGLAVLRRTAQGGGSASATWSRGVLHVTVPYEAPRAGAGQLIVEVLDPEDQVLARVERRAEIGAGSGSWREDLKLTRELAMEDLVWHRNSSCAQ